MTEHLFIAGAQRSGTSYLHALLDQHPAIRMVRPLRPEPKYFLDADVAAADYQHYLNQCFAGDGDSAWLGEKSTSYIEHPEVAERIARLLPRARLIFVLREPAARAYSNWCFSRDHGIEPLGFAEALAAEPERLKQWDRKRYSVCPFAYASRGHYAAQLEVWAGQFPREQIRLLTSEALFDQPASLDGLLRWLGVDADAPIVQRGPLNASKEDSPPPGSLEALRLRYASDREQLAGDWGLDTSVWQP